MASMIFDCKGACCFKTLVEIEKDNTVPLNMLVTFCFSKKQQCPHLELIRCTTSGKDTLFGIAFFTHLRNLYVECTQKNRREYRGNHGVVEKRSREPRLISHDCF